jgi:FixJ family two-component response regulator
VAHDEPLVIIIDDDAAIREALDDLLQSVGVATQAHGSVQSFLAAGVPDTPCCLVLDVRLPGQSGLELQDHLARAKVEVPIIFITGHGDVPMSVRAMKAGAMEFLQKPFRDQELLDAINAAIARDRESRARQRESAGLRERFDALSERERQVLTHVVTGRLNKQIANDLGLSEITVKVHRGQVMRKMGAQSLADLVRMADRLGLAVGS